MIQFEPKEQIPIARQIGDPAETSTLYVRAYVRDAKTDDLLNTVDLTDKGDQRFRGVVEAPADTSGQGRYITITTKVFTDSGYTTESQLYSREEFTYLVQERPRAHFGGGGVDVNYEKIKKMIDEAVGRVPKVDIPAQKETDLRPVLRAVDEIRKKVEQFKIPDFPKFLEIPKPKEVDFTPLLKAINSAEDAILRAISEIPEPEKLKPVIELLEKIKDNMRTPIEIGLNIDGKRAAKKKIKLDNFGEAKEQLINTPNFRKYFVKT